MNKSAAVVPVLLLALFTVLYRAPRPDLKAHFQDKVVLLCGVGFGVGDETAYELARAGAKLFLVARVEDKVRTLFRLQQKFDIEDPAILQVGQLMVARTEGALVRVSDRAVELGSPAAEMFSFDFNNATNASIIVEKAIERFGTIDYLVLNHAESPRGSILNTKYHQTPEFVDRTFSVNVFSYIEIAMKSLPFLEKSKGAIFVASSTLGEVPDSRLPLFSATKHALNGFFYSLQQDLASKKSPVSITMGSLGMVNTEEMINMFRVPEWMYGDLVECAQGIVASLISHPNTFTFPTLHPLLARTKWLFS